MSAARQIPLSRGLFATVDAGDYEALAGDRWFAVPMKSGSSKFYAARNIVGADGRARREWMHRRLAGAQGGEVVDHVNGDGLDNRRANLRRCSPRQNVHNRRLAVIGPYRGVCQVEGGWAARIYDGDRKVALGTFEDPEAAARAYDAAASATRGQFAVLNFGSPQRPREAPMTMEQAAAAVGLSKERFRKVWRGMVADSAFPRPIAQPALGAEAYLWARADIETWQRLQEQRNAVRLPRQKTTYNDR